MNLPLNIVKLYNVKDKETTLVSLEKEQIMYKGTRRKY